MSSALSTERVDLDVRELPAEYLTETFFLRKRRKIFRIHVPVEGDASPLACSPALSGRSALSVFGRDKVEPEGLEDLLFGGAGPLQNPCTPPAPPRTILSS